MKSALIKLHIAILLAGFTAILGKLISLTEASLVWWRLAITVVVMWGWMLAAKRVRVYPRKTIAQLLGIGAVVGLHWLCFFGSVKYSNVSIALVCFSSAGFFSAVMEPVIAQRKWVPAELLLGLISMAGIYVIFHFDAQYKTGILLGVAGAALSSIFSILNKRIIHQVDGVGLTAWEMLGALIILSGILPFYMHFGSTTFLPVGWDWLWLCILAVICTVWAFMLQLQSLKFISAFTLNLSYNLEPVYGIILAFIFFKENEQLSSRFYIGVLLILVSILLQMWRVWKQTKKPTVVDIPSNDLPESIGLY
ncbi:MAG: DMT family transporter [Chitinophagaceae bacterium]